MIKVIAVPVGPLETNSYIAVCNQTKEAVIIDPGFDIEYIRAQIDQCAASVSAILLTHGHFDHCSALGGITEIFSAPVYMHRDDIPYVAEAQNHSRMYGISVPHVPLPDRFIDDDDTITFGECTLRVIHTPGHTPGGVCFYTPDILFAGDTLFSESVGRTDLPGGSFEAISTSIKEKLYTLPDDTVVYPGHGLATTIGKEKNSNPYVKA